MTVIGLPKKKKKTESQTKLISFKKLSPIEKDRMILSFLSTSQAVGEAIAGKRLLKDGAYYCYCAYVLRISRHSDFLSVILTNTGIFLRGLKLPGESRS